MIVKLLKPWRYRKVGTVLNEVPEGAANLLILRGVAEKYTETVQPEPEPEAEPTRRYTKRVRA